MAVWYFAYGANMHRDVLVRRRRLRPLRSEAGTLHGYELRFDEPGLPLLEPCFASIRACSGELVHGVLHLLSDDDSRAMDGFEGAGYARVEVRAVGRTSGAVDAWTYVNRKALRGRRPSRRYMTLLIEGARQHDLPESWIARLQGTPTTHVPILGAVVPRLIEIVERDTRIGRRLTRLVHALFDDDG